VFDQACGRVMVCAFGPAEHQVLCAAAAMGADLRIGFENNIHGEGGTLAANNATQIARLVAALSSFSAKGVSA
jgi:3-keto-5-aminohexanoate cleavage enzyme